MDKCIPPLPRGGGEGCIIPEGGEGGDGCHGLLTPEANTVIGYFMLGSCA